MDFQLEFELLSLLKYVTEHVCMHVQILSDPLNNDNWTNFYHLNTAQVWCLDSNCDVMKQNVCIC